MGPLRAALAITVVGAAGAGAGWFLARRHAPHPPSAESRRAPVVAEPKPSSAPAVETRPAESGAGDASAMIQILLPASGAPRRPDASLREMLESASAEIERARLAPAVELAARLALGHELRVLDAPALAETHLRRARTLADALHDGASSYAAAAELGALLRRLRRNREAETQLQQALDLRPSHPLPPEIAARVGADPVEELADLWIDEGKAASVATLLKPYLDAQGADAPVARPSPADRARMLASLARVHIELGSISEARDVCKQAIETARTALGENHPRAIVCRALSARIDAAAGEFESAERTYRWAIDAMRDAMPREPETIAVEREFAALLENQQRPAEAAAVRQDVVLRAENVAGIPPLERAQYEKELASALVAAGRVAEAEAGLERAVEWGAQSAGDAAHAVRVQLLDALLTCAEAEHDGAKIQRRRADLEAAQKVSVQAGGPLDTKRR